MSVESHKNPECAHCSIADAIISWRESEGAEKFVSDQRRGYQADTSKFSDDQLVRFAVMRGLAMIVIDLVREEADSTIQVMLLNTFQNASIEHQIRLGHGGLQPKANA